MKDFKYLGSWIADSARDINTRKAKAWVACHKLKKIWNSNLKDELKIRLFVACVESVLLYGCETWTLTKDQERSLNGTYTRMLRMALNKNQYLLRMTNCELYGDLPILSTKIAERRLRHAGHAFRHPELTLNSVLLWEPSHGKTKRGRPKLTFVDTIRRDTGVKSVEEIGSMMAGRDSWRKLTNSVREYHSP